MQRNSFYKLGIKWWSIPFGLYKMHFSTVQEFRVPKCREIHFITSGLSSFFLPAFVCSRLLSSSGKSKVLGGLDKKNDGMRGFTYTEGGG